MICHYVTSAEDAVMPSHGQWIRGMGKPQGSVFKKGVKWGVHLKSKVYKKYKTVFRDRTAAKAYRWKKSNKYLLTRNRIRRSGRRGVYEMMIHRGRGCSWRGDTAMFDSIDLPLVLQHIGKWTFSTDGYVYAKIAGKGEKFCNLIRPPPRGMINDHINRDRSDDRRSNLRHVSQKVNARNMSRYRNNSTGENGITEVYHASFKSFDHAKGVRFPSRGPMTSNLAGRDLQKEARDLRDRLSAKTKIGKIPKITYRAWWSVMICRSSADGGAKTFAFNPDDEADRARARQEAVVYRDMLQARCASNNGKQATQT